ncbi:MAG TPA: hypothetical protein VIM58_07290, partial [Candidatus Methylacidiphilales bacterium]
ASHSVEHVTDPVKEDGWPGPGWEAAESKRQLDAGLQGQNTKLFAYPGSPIKEFNGALAWRPDVTKYYAAARGVSGNPINVANQIDYFNIRTTSNPKGILEGTTFVEWNLQNILTRNPDKDLGRYYRGWFTLFTHSINQGKDWETNPATQPFIHIFDWVTEHRDDFWIGHLDDVALYGEERDTATLETAECSAGRIVLKLSCEMDPAVFDYPLTVKVRLPDGWKGIEASQGGKALSATVVLHENAPYGLVKAVPGTEPVVITPSPK